MKACILTKLILLGSSDIFLEINELISQSKLLKINEKKFKISFQSTMGRVDRVMLDAMVWLGERTILVKIELLGRRLEGKISENDNGERFYV